MGKEQAKEKEKLLRFSFSLIQHSLLKIIMATMSSMCS